MEVVLREVGNVLTRTTGFLKTVTSHSLQPYRGCSFGNSLCGVGCYVRHNPYVTRGRAWGSFLEVRENAAASYRRHWRRERTWARRVRRRFGVFLSSSTEPFLPQEFRYRVTGSVLEAMLEQPPDLLVLQTHSHRVTDYEDLCLGISRRCRLRGPYLHRDRSRCGPGSAPARQFRRPALRCRVPAQTARPLYRDHRFSAAADPGPGTFFPAHR